VLVPTSLRSNASFPSSLLYLPTSSPCLSCFPLIGLLGSMSEGRGEWREEAGRISGLWIRSTRFGYSRRRPRSSTQSQSRGQSTPRIYLRRSIVQPVRIASATTTTTAWKRYILIGRMPHRDQTSSLAVVVTRSDGPSKTPALRLYCPGKISTGGSGILKRGGRIRGSGNSASEAEQFCFTDDDKRGRGHETTSAIALTYCLCVCVIWPDSDRFDFWSKNTLLKWL